MKKQVIQLLLGGLSGKLLGFLRELVIAALFGAGAIASAFRLAQSAFLIPIQGFSSEALNAGFIPLQARLLKSAPASARLAMDTLYVLFSLISFAVGIGLYAFAGAWARFLAPGFSPQALALSTAMVQAMAVSLPAYVIGSLQAAALHANGHTGYMASRASAMSVGVLVGSGLAWWLKDGIWLAWSFTGTQYALLIWGWALNRKAMSVLPQPGRHTWPQRLELVRPVGYALLNLIWIPVIMQVHFVVERRVATNLVSDAMSTLDYARFVSETAVLLMAMPVGMAGLAAMPTMTTKVFKDTCSQSFKALLMVGVPLSAMVGMNAPIIVNVLFKRGAFDSNSAALTSTILAASAWGLTAQLIQYAGLKFLSARGQYRQALLITCSGVGLNILINLTVTQKLGVAGLGWASSANAVVQSLFALWALGVIRATLVTAFSLAAAGVGIAALMYFIGQVNPWLALVVQGACWCGFMLAWPDSRRLVRSLFVKQST